MACVAGHSRGQARLVGPPWLPHPVHLRLHTHCSASL
eukprot:jgi/Astpho2/9524/gw1.00145.187.1_t